MQSWLEASGRRPGYTVPAQTMFDLSGEWYAGRMDEAWSPFTPSEAEAIFRRHGLTGEFWALG